MKMYQNFSLKQEEISSNWVRKIMFRGSACRPPSCPFSCVSLSLQISPSTPSSAAAAALYRPGTGGQGSEVPGSGVRWTRVGGQGSEVPGWGVSGRSGPVFSSNIMCRVAWV